MYNVYINGQYFGSDKANDQKNKLIDPQVRVEVNKAGTFQCTITPLHQCYNKLVKMQSFVRVYQNEDHIFSGRLLYTESDSYGQMVCYFEGDLSYFIDSVQEPGLYEETIRERFVRLIEVHNSQVEPEKQFYPGMMELDEADEENVFQDTTYKDTKSLLDSLVDDYGGYLAVRHFGGVSYLDYLKEYDGRSKQELRFKKNILDIQHNISGEELFTVLLPLGEVPNEEDISAVDEDSEEDPYEPKIMTIESVNNGNKFLLIDKLVEVFGWIVKVQAFNNAKTPEDLLNMANQYIEDMSPGLADTVTITALDESFLNSNQDPIRLGDLVEISYDPLGLKKVMACVSIEYDLANPENSVYHFGVLKQDLSGKYSSTVNVYENYTENNNTVVNRYNKIINHIEEDLIVNARDIKINSQNIEINAQDIITNARNIEVNAQDILVNARDIEINARDIKVNARDIEVNARNIAINAEKLAVIAEEILLYAKKDYVDEIEGRTTELEAYIKVLPGIIEMMATKKEVTELGETLRNEASITIDGVNARIDMKASSESVTALEKKVNSAEIVIDGLNADIKLKASSESVTALEKRVTSAEVDINGLESTITLKADSKVVKGLEERVGSAEVQINGMDGTIRLISTNVTSTMAMARRNEESIEMLQGEIKLKASTTTVDGLSTKVTTAEANINSLKGEILLKASQSEVSAISQSNYDAWIAIQALDATTKDQGSKITLKADKIELRGYVTMEDFEAQSAYINQLTSGIATANGLVATNLYALQTLWYNGTRASWKDISVGTSVNSPLFNYVTLQYKDHSGTNKSQVVLTSVNTAASLNKTTFKVLGSE